METLKLHELIERLAQIVATHGGDLEVQFESDEYAYAVTGVTADADYNTVTLTNVSE